jgi:hypothetical protein
MGNDYAQEFFDFLILNLCAFKEETGNVIPISFFLLFNNESYKHIIVDEVGDQTLEKIRKYALETGACYVFSASEAWASKTISGKPSEQEDREEIILISAEGPGLNKVAQIRIFEDGTLGEPQISEAFSGRLTGLLPSQEYH